MLAFPRATWLFIVSLVAAAWFRLSRHTQRLKDAYVRSLAGSKKLADSDHAHTCAHSAGPGYGYQGKLNRVLKTEFPQLQDRVYADHAGATLYTKSQIEAVQQDLESHLFGNPHSQHGWSGNVGSAAAVVTARKLTLEMCNAPLGEYECVFTAGATVHKGAGLSSYGDSIIMNRGALKLVGEAFPWQDGSHFVYTQDNHNSVLGIRELALDCGATASCVEIDSHKGQDFHCCAVSPPMQRTSSPHSKLSCDVTHSSQPRGKDRAAAQRGPSLFAFPLESNFSGARYGPAMVHHIQTEGLVVASQKQAEEKEQNLARSQAQEPRTPGQLQSGVQPVFISHHQRDHEQYNEAEEVQQAAQGWTKEEEEHWQHQLAAEEEAAESLSGQQGGEDEEEAGGLPSRSSQSEGARWHVLIDAAKACATAPPDLTKHPADFVALSYYKIFGYPTGLGALLVHKRAVPLLIKRQRYFGGGTVAVSVADEDFFRRRDGAAGLEDGTAHYLGIAAVSHGFRQLASLGGFPAIARHTQAVTRLFVTQLAELRHPNGSPFCIVYGAHSLSSDQPSSCSPGVVGQGPVVTFNLLRSDCSYVGYREVEKLAGLHAIFLRTGCFCNPGACAHHLGLTASQLKQNYEAGHVCWDDNDIIDGRPTGAVRVSFGWMSSEEDVHAILTFLKTCFLGSAGRQAPCGHNLHRQNLHGQNPQGQNPSGHNLHRHNLHGQNFHGHNLQGQNPQGKNPTTARAATMKGTGKGQSSVGHNLSEPNPGRHNPDWHNPGGRNPGVQDPTFSVNAHCSTAIPSAADPNHHSPVHSTACNNSDTPQAQAPGQGSHRLEGSSQPLYDSVVSDKTSSLSVESQQPEQTGGRDHTQSAELRTSAQDVTRQHSKRCAWLRQLPWVRCGDKVTAWTASQDESPGLTSPYQSSSGVQHRGQSGGQHGGQHQTQPGDLSGGLPGVLHGGLPLGTSTPPCTSLPASAHSAIQLPPDSDSQSAVESASLSVSPSHFQHDPDSHSVPSSMHHAESQQACSRGSLEGIWVYPIKSCGGMRVPEWPLGPNGLLLDREWALVGDDGHVLTQKGLPQMALLQPRVDLGQGFMQISSPAMSTQLLVALPWSGSETSPAVQDQPGATMQVRVCADNVCSLQEVVSVHSQEEVRAWFQQALGVRCCLVRQRPGSRKPVPPLQPERQNDPVSSGHIGFANEGQFLLMNSASLADMNARIAAQAGNRKKRTASNVGEVSRFRPNLLVGGSGVAAYAEDGWQTVHIGTQSFFTAGPCARCEMVCMNQTTGVRAGPEPLLTLASYRRQRGRIFLGILLGQRS